MDHVYKEHPGGHRFLADRSVTFLSPALVGAERFISPPRLTLTGTGVDAVMQFSTQAGVDYRIEHTTNLDTAQFPWTPFEAVKGTGQPAQVSVPIYVNHGFFRLSARNPSTP